MILEDANKYCFKLRFAEIDPIVHHLPQRQHILRSVYALEQQKPDICHLIATNMFWFIWSALSAYLHAEKAQRVRALVQLMSTWSSN